MTFPSISLDNVELTEETSITKESSGDYETLFINNSQAMQGWEKELMERSADILCGSGGRFLEAGLGLGFSALRIAGAPGTASHTVVEKYAEVIGMFRESTPVLPASLNIVQADIFDYIFEAEEASCDGIFFDPALPMYMWRDTALWDRVVPRIKALLKPGGRFVPFFSTKPELRAQFMPFFDKVIVEKHRFKAYDDTNYTHTQQGSAYIQCFINDGL